MQKVYAAINAVQRDLATSGISKDRTNSFDNYKFRGIDDVYNALSPLLAKHGLCILPRILTRHVDERQAKDGKAMFYVTVEAEFDFVATEDGSKHTVRTFGEAMDRGDKATNKAMSAAYKYAAFQAFAIPTEGDNDADAHTHEVKPRAISPLDGAQDRVPPEELEILRELAADVVDICQKDSPEAAQIKIDQANLDNDQKAALWDLLKPNSAVRSALKKVLEARKLKAAA